MFSKHEFKIMLWCIIGLLVFGLLNAAFASETKVNPVFEKVEIQRVHDDDAAVTCWVLYVPSSKADGDDSYGFSCLPNTVIKPEGRDD